MSCSGGARALRALTLAAVTSLSLGLAAPVRAGWYPLAGASWYVPSDTAVSDVYGSGPGIVAGLGYHWTHYLRTEIRLGWYRTTADLDAALASQARGTLTLLPFVAELRYLPWVVPAGSGVLAPWIGAGPALVFSREEFGYSVFGEKTSLDGQRSDFGGSIGGGVEWRRDRWALGLAGHAVLTGGHREVLRTNERTDERGAEATPSHFTIGLELKAVL